MFLVSHETVCERRNTQRKNFSQIKTGMCLVLKTISEKRNPTNTKIFKNRQVHDYEPMLLSQVRNKRNTGPYVHHMKLEWKATAKHLTVFFHVIKEDEEEASSSKHLSTLHRRSRNGRIQEAGHGHMDCSAIFQLSSASDWGWRTSAMIRNQTASASNLEDE